MPDPAFLLALVMVMLLTAYVLLGGADYGGGVWDLLATGRTAKAQRETIARAIAPVWEANHVWLIVVVTILFTAFPPAFARLSIVLHIPLALVLIGIIVRGSAFIFRAYGPMSKGDRRGLEWVFAAASTITPLLLGVIVGAVTEGGIVQDAHEGASFQSFQSFQSFRELYVNPWMTPFAVAVGVFALVLFSYLAAVYLTLEAREKATADAFRRRALAAAILTGVMAFVIFLLAGDAPHVRASLMNSPWALPLHLATGTAATAALVLLWTRRFWWARTAAIVQVSLIVWGWALAQSPYLIRPDLTFEMAAAPRQVLVLLLQVLAAGAIVLLPSLFYLFRLFGPSDRSA